MRFGKIKSILLEVDEADNDSQSKEAVRLYFGTINDLSKKKKFKTRIIFSTEDNRYTGFGIVPMMQVTRKKDSLYSERYNGLRSIKEFLIKEFSLNLVKYFS